ncbi:MAG: hypothetical protein WCQ87_05435 [Parabacteroides sp.]
MITIFLSIFSPTGYVSEFPELNIPGFPPIIITQTRTNKQINTETNVKTSKVYKRTTRYNSLGMAKKDIICFDDSNAYGEYFSLDLDLWKELDYSVDEHKRINVGRQHAGHEIRLFIQTNVIDEFKIVDNIIMFSRAGWSELRRVRGENRGLPLEVNENGTIWIGDRAGQGKLKIFILKV